MAKRAKWIRRLWRNSMRGRQPRAPAACPSHRRRSGAGRRAAAPLRRGGWPRARSVFEGPGCSPRAGAGRCVHRCILDQPCARFRLHDQCIERIDRQLRVACQPKPAPAASGSASARGLVVTRIKPRVPEGRSNRYHQGMGVMTTLRTGAAVSALMVTIGFAQGPHAGPRRRGALVAPCHDARR